MRLSWRMPNNQTTLKKKTVNEDVKNDEIFYLFFRSGVQKYIERGIQIQFVVHLIMFTLFVERKKKKQ